VPTRSNLQASSSAASSACTAERASDSAVLPVVRLASPVEPSGLTFDVRQLAPLVDLRFCFPIALQLAPLLDRSASPSTVLVSLRRELRFRICLPASPLGLHRLVRLFSLAFRSVDRLAPSTELPASAFLPRRSAYASRPSLSALPSYHTAEFSAAFILWRCPSTFSSALALRLRRGPIRQI